jgi:DNA-binding NtrC family response regulator
LRERPTDVPLLAQHYLEEANATPHAAGRSGFTTEALDDLTGYPWPGELAELRDVVRAAVQRSAGRQITAADLPPQIRLAEGAVAYPRPEVQPIMLDEYLAGIEKQVLQRALAAAKQNKTKAAELLGINRARLLRRLAQLGLSTAESGEDEVIFQPLPEESDT